MTHLSEGIKSDLITFFDVISVFVVMLATSLPSSSS